MISEVAIESETTQECNEHSDNVYLYLLNRDLYSASVLLVQSGFKH